MRRPARRGSHPRVREAEGRRPPLLRAAAAVRGWTGTARGGRNPRLLPAPGRTVPKPKTAAVGAPIEALRDGFAKPSRDTTTTPRLTARPRPSLATATGAQLGRFGAARTNLAWLFKTISRGSRHGPNEGSASRPPAISARRRAETGLRRSDRRHRSTRQVRSRAIGSPSPRPQAGGRRDRAAGHPVRVVVMDVADVSGTHHRHRAERISGRRGRECGRAATGSTGRPSGPSSFRSDVPSRRHRPAPRWPAWRSPAGLLRSRGGRSSWACST